MSIASAFILITGAVAYLIICIVAGGQAVWFIRGGDMQKGVVFATASAMVLISLFYQIHMSAMALEAM